MSHVAWIEIEHPRAVTDTSFIRFLRSQSAPLAVAASIGFSLGLLFAALFFPARVEVVEVQVPAAVGPGEDVRQVPTAPKATYTPVAMDSLPGWSADKISNAYPALVNGCRVFESRDPSQPIRPVELAGQTSDWLTPCAALNAVSPDDETALRHFLSDHFTVYAVETPAGATGTFTGYYETSLNGSLTRTEKYNVPLYGLPQDIVELDRRAFALPDDLPAVVGRVTNRRLVPYDTRVDIEDNQSFIERANVLVWVDDPVDAHLLHIQGSGRVRLPDGSERRIGYAGNNGHRFRGIGSILLDAGAIGAGQGSMPGVAAWLRQNPDQGRRYMQDNPRFIFFRWIDGPGPIGAAGVPLVNRRSLAVDPRYIPYGAPMWLDVEDPDGLSLNRLVVALDTGSAIRGAVRGDFFWGAGSDAFDKAGRMKSAGRYYLFLPRTIALPPDLEGKSL